MPNSDVNVAIATEHAAITICKLGVLRLTGHASLGQTRLVGSQWELDSSGCTTLSIQDSPNQI